MQVLSRCDDSADYESAEFTGSCVRQGVQTHGDRRREKDNRTHQSRYHPQRHIHRGVPRHLSRFLFRSRRRRTRGNHDHSIAFSTTVGLHIGNRRSRCHEAHPVCRRRGGDGEGGMWIGDAGNGLRSRLVHYVCVACDERRSQRHRAGVHPTELS